VANLEVDPTLAAPTPARIGIFDDVLTTGAHYRAARIVLSHRFPQVPVVGFFIAVGSLSRTTGSMLTTTSDLSVFWSTPPRTPSPRH
jgi:hypothetical protein